MRSLILIAIIMLTGCTSMPEQRVVQHTKATKCINAGPVKQCTEQTIKVWVE
ncbi:hypothetical protein [Endozoicomonas arenosclerae]|uniref:hypothetical protein n=1 Tax=Endozoicomonas arenosclerae TaxID=1633495 RepID=UPI000B2CC153|nr:hypothetical protein [Endozoicomonas arenosclerae]